MKVVFLGPSAQDTELPDLFSGILICPPAGQGDVAAAVLAGAAVIGLVDGTFEQDAAVWHKELLFALAQGVQVFGAASMGALRAAECAAFGMIGIGENFQAYADGTLVDDDSVAVVHAPPELGSAPLSQPLVNMRATFSALLEKGLVTEAEHAGLTAAAGALFFKERTYDAVLRRAFDPALDPSGARGAELRKLIALHHQDVKRRDAIALLEAVAAAPPGRVDPPEHWQFVETRAWLRLLAALPRES